MRKGSLVASGTVIALAFAALVGLGIAMVALYKSHESGLPPVYAHFALLEGVPANATVHDLDFRTVHARDSFLEDHLNTALDHGTILADSSRLDLSPFANFKIVAVPSDEWMAANILLVNSTVCMPEGFPKTRSMLEKRGLKVATTDISEFLKAEAGLTCMSLLFAA